MTPGKRTALIARHNLWVSKMELERVKRAIMEGDLWELVERRCRSHPALLDALQSARASTRSSWRSMNRCPGSTPCSTPVLRRSTGRRS